MKIGNLNINPPIISAPMAGITNSVYRLMVKKFGASLVFSEMISAEATIRSSPKTEKIIHIDDNEHPIAVQIFGGNPTSMAEAARIVEAKGADIVDINMGCSVKKVLKNNAGATLINEHPLALEVADKVLSAVKVPVTVKLRSDYHDNDNKGIELAQKLANSGVSAITLHPRSKTQLFSGKADWEKITDLKKSVDIPVIGSGDIYTVQDALHMINKIGADGVMIARGALGNPWIFTQTKAALEGHPIPEKIDIIQKINILKRLISDLTSFYKTDKGIKISRKHILWFLKGIPNSNKIKEQIVKADNIDKIFDILSYVV